MEFFILNIGNINCSKQHLFYNCLIYRFILSLLATLAQLNMLAKHFQGGIFKTAL
jgi:hypothetical protein